MSEDKLLLNLISATMRKSTPDCTGDFGEEFYKLALRQQVHTLVYPALSRLPEDKKPSEDIMKVWKNAFTFTSFRLASFFNFVKTLIDTFEENACHVTLLKGSVYRELYPSCELRTMGDIDLIISRDNVEFFESVISRFGYTRKVGGHDEDLAYEYVAEQKPHIEIFFSLREDFREKYDVKYEKDIVNYHVYKYVHMLAPVSATVHHVAHFTKHFYNLGAGIRFIADLYALLSQPELNFNDLVKELKAIKCYKFFEVCLEVLKVYFDYSSPIETSCDEKLREQFIDYLMRYGIYGNQTSSMVLKKGIKEKGRIKALLSMIFPSPKKLKSKFPYFKKHPMLLPIAWFRHVITYLKAPKMVRNSLKYITSKDSVDDIKMYKQLEE